MEEVGEDLELLANLGRTGLQVQTLKLLWTQGSRVQTLEPGTEGCGSDEGHDNGAGFSDRTSIPWEFEE